MSAVSLPESANTLLVDVIPADTAQTDAPPTDADGSSANPTPADALSIPVPRRKSAQRAGNSMRKFSAFLGPKSDSDSEGFVKSESCSSSSDDESGGMVSSGGGGSDGSEGDCVDFSGDEERVGIKQMKTVIYDTARVYNDILKVQVETYKDKLTYLEVAQLNREDLDEHVNISVNGHQLSAYSSINTDGSSIGYAAGTPKIARWLPHSDVIILAVSNNSHIVTFSKAVLDNIQLWTWEPGDLNILYSIKMEPFSDFIVYPYRTSSCENVTLCVSCQDSIRLYTFPLTKPSDGLHYRARTPSLPLSISNKDTGVIVRKIQWSVFDGHVNVLGALSNGYILKWNLTKKQQTHPLLPEQSVAAHPTHPITDISVCPQAQQYFCSTSHDSRIRVWNLKNFKRPVCVRSKNNKQMLLATQIHWCSFWNQLLCLSMMPKRQTPYANNNIYVVSTQSIPRVHKFLNFTVPNIFPNEVSSLFPRCFDFSDQHSNMVVGFQCGTTIVNHIATLFHNQKKRFQLGERFRYLRCSAKVKENADVSKDFTNDQDYINHFNFTVLPDLSNSLPNTSESHKAVSRKCLTAVTCAEWQKLDYSGRNVCVSYMSGFFQVLQVPSDMILTKVNS